MLTNRVRIEKELKTLNRRVNRVACSNSFIPVADGKEICAGKSYLIPQNQDVVLPKSPNSGDTIYFVPGSGDWQSLNGSFILPDGTSLLNTDQISQSDTQVLALVYIADENAWAFFQAGEKSDIDITSTNTLWQEEQW